jgi:hypothetical protein
MFEPLSVLSKQVLTIVSKLDIIIVSRMDTIVKENRKRSKTVAKRYITQGAQKQNALSDIFTVILEKSKRYAVR